MTPYIRNRSCQCVRCRAHGLMGAAVLITLGVLFLMNNYYILRFEQGLPALLLVIGCVLLIARTGSTEGHIQPGWIYSHHRSTARPAVANNHHCCTASAISAMGFQCGQSAIVFRPE